MQTYTSEQYATLLLRAERKARVATNELAKLAQRIDELSDKYGPGSAGSAMTTLNNLVRVLVACAESHADSSQFANRLAASVKCDCPGCDSCNHGALLRNDQPPQPAAAVEGTTTTTVHNTTSISPTTKPF